MAKDDLILIPTVITATSPEELSKAVAAERIRREQTHAKAYYSAVYVQRNGNGGSGNNGYTKYIAFIEFNTKEK
jgi:hypothetical protein